MTQVPKELIKDLIPAYLAGDVSDKTRRLIDEYARHDQEIADLIQSYQSEALLDPLAVQPNEQLEFKTLENLRKSFRTKVLLVAILTSIILLLPLTAMNFTTEVSWDLLDFAVMAIMLMAAGLIYVALSNLSSSLAYKCGVGLAVLTGFLIIWFNLAVGLIGASDNPANLLYLLVFLSAGITIKRAKFKAVGMASAMFITAGVQILIPLLGIGTFQSDAEASAGELAMNGVITLFLLIAGAFFKHAANTDCLKSH